MKILLDNVNIKSTSGPNSFAKKLKHQLEKTDHEIGLSVSKDFFPDVQLSFIVSYYKFAPIVQRLDGIYFNLDQDYMDLNDSILSTYHASSHVIFQSDFNKTLIEKWFGDHENSHVIRNGTDIEKISQISHLDNIALDKFENVWTCASSWRPHKRLAENIRYFLENSGENDCLVVAGENPDSKSSSDRIFYSDHLSWTDLISLYKRSKYFIHLAWLDHCPNVVVDARSCGCHIICSSSGGTHEIAGLNSTVIIEDQWDFKPVRLYNPPVLDFSKNKKGETNSDISMENVSREYLGILEKAALENE